MATAGEGAPGRARYAWQWAGQWHHLEVRTRGRPLVPPADSEAAFITEHYWGYTAQRDGGCKAYQVSHPQWRVWDAEGSSFDCDAAALYGPGFAECLAAPPRSAFVAEGSAVTVYAGTRIPVTVDSTRATAHHAS
jgi:hypothetical protein